MPSKSLACVEDLYPNGETNTNILASNMLSLGDYEFVVEHAKKKKKGCLTISRVADNDNGEKESPINTRHKRQITTLRLLDDKACKIPDSTTKTM